MSKKQNCQTLNVQQSKLQEISNIDGNKIENNGQDHQLYGSLSTQFDLHERSSYPSFEIQNLNNNSLGDITENLDSVYLVVTEIEDKKIQKPSNIKEKKRQIRYSVKKDKQKGQKKYKRRPQIFTDEEDKKLQSFILRKGPKFQKFQRYFPGKSINMLKNRYYKYLRYVSQNVSIKESIKSEEKLGQQQNLNSKEDSYSIKFEQIKEQMKDLEIFPKAQEILSNLFDSMLHTFNELKNHM